MMIQLLQQVATTMLVLAAILFVGVPYVAWMTGRCERLAEARSLPQRGDRTGRRLS